jgi:hypothetical protein
MADTIFINDDGIQTNLDNITGKASVPIGGGGVKLHLFKNNITVSKTNVLGDVNGAGKEADFAGYAPVVLNGGTWGAAAVGGHVASATYGTAVAFTRGSTGAAQSCYGWYLTDGGVSKLYACANFAGGPLVVTNAGDQILVTPTLTDQSLN